MTEGRKTAIFALVAGVITAAAWGTSLRNTNSVSDVRGLIGSTLYEKFTDPLTAASMKILKYNKSKEAFDEFEVTKDRNTGLWTIPSHESYPADANKQMADAATLFVGLKVLDVASERLADQALFGVVEPNKQKEAEGGEGVGMLVQLRDEKGEILADAIIGKEAEGKRFVRVPSSDVIYVCELDTAPLSTDFKSWIESDLLQLSANDVETLGIRDYQILPTNQGMVLSRNFEADVTFNPDNGKWNARKITDYSGEKPKEMTLEESQSVNSTKLSEIRNILDTLKIVDVAKKPSGLAADLKGDRSKLGPDAISSLQRRGFFPNPNQKQGDVVDFLSKNGELLVTLRDGVQYLLRFGGSASTEINEAEEPGSESTVSVNPYLLVTARVDQSKFPEPILAKVPESVEELKAIEALNDSIRNSSPLPSTTNDVVNEAPASEAASEPAQAEQPTAPTEQPAESADQPVAPAEQPETPEAPAEPSAAPTSEASESVPAEQPAATTDDAQSNASRAVPGKLAAFVQEETQPTAPTEAEGNEAQGTNANDAPVETPAATQELTEEEWKEKLEVTRERITKENTRKIDERNEKLKVAQSKVNQLNRRFADWYYVISESDYNKLKVTLPNLIQANADAGASPAAPGGAFPGFTGEAFPGPLSSPLSGGQTDQQ